MLRDASLAVRHGRGSTLYFNELLGPIVGWLNTREYDRTGDEQASQGWCPQVIDTNGDGKITKPWNPPDGPIDARRDTEVRYNLYSVIPSPVDGSAWGASEHFPGYIVRVDRGDNPPETCITEVYKVPEPGIDPRGIDIDSNGIVWTALAASSHLASFDRTKCSVLNGPRRSTARTARQDGSCMFPTAPVSRARTFRPTSTTTTGSISTTSRASARTRRSRPARTPTRCSCSIPKPANGPSCACRTRSGSIIAVSTAASMIRAAGWKGRGLWANYGTHLIWHTEGGKGTAGKTVHFQIRPDPLAH